MLTQKDMEIEDPKREDVYSIGTVALVMRMLKLPDGRVRILAQGIVRAEVESLNEDKPYYSAQIKVLHEEDEEEIEKTSLVRQYKDIE